MAAKNRTTNSRGRWSVLLVAAAAAAVAAGTANHVAAEGSTLNGYDFGYSIAGDAKVTPIQVFDDGAQTYFQFKTSESVPAIFRLNRGRQELTEITQQSPYVVVPGVAQQFALRSGTSAFASVNYIGGRRNEPVLPTARAAIDAEIHAVGVPKAREASVEARLAQMLEALLAQNPKSGARLLGEPDPRLDSGASKAPPVVTRTETLVPFIRGRSSLGPLGTRIMTRLALDASSATEVQITGRGDPRLPGIAASRASTLKAFLIARGIAAEKIHADERPESRPFEMKDAFASEVVLFIPSKGPADRFADAAASREIVAGEGRDRLPPSVSTTLALLKQGRLSADAAASILETSLAGTPRLTPSRRRQLAAVRTRWEISPEDATLRNALSKWAGEAGWQLSWDMPYDYPIRLRAAFEGNFEEAITAIAKTFEGADVPIQVTFYRGNRVLRVLAAAEKSK